MTLFEECFLALTPTAKILSLKETEYYFSLLTQNFSVTSWQRLNWDLIPIKKSIHKINEIFEYLESMNIQDFEVVLLWNYTSEPGIKTNLSDVLKVIDDVLAVGSDTFVFCPHGKYVIEFYHDGEVTLGLANNKSLSDNS